MQHPFDSDLKDSEMNDDEEEPKPFGRWLLLIGTIFLILKGMLVLIELLGD